MFLFYFKTQAMEMFGDFPIWFIKVAVELFSFLSLFQPWSLEFRYFFSKSFKANSHQAEPLGFGKCHHYFKALVLLLLSLFSGQTAIIIFF